MLEMVDGEDVEHLGEEDGLWFDYTFVEFLKTNYSQFFAPFAEYGRRLIFLDRSFGTTSYSTRSKFVRTGSYVLLYPLHASDDANEVQ